METTEEATKRDRRPRERPSQAPRTLLDCRWAYRNAESKRRGTAGQEKMRTLCQNDFKAFMVMFRSEEKAWQERQAVRNAQRGAVTEGVSGKGVPVVGPERALLAAERLLEQWSERPKVAETA